MTASAQDHFGGITTSKRVGILNVGMNPSELSNLKSKFEVQLFSTSINVANDKIGFKDITSDTNLEICNEALKLEFCHYYQRSC